jgi:hypothetical protein
MELETYINNDYGKPLFAIKNKDTDKDIIKFGETKARALVAAMPQIQKYVESLDAKKKKVEPAPAKADKTKTKKSTKAPF